jgi:pimeloyl-ACP methyl ester carboxylesterase
LTTFVLIHGAWHGAWCWRKLAPLLETAGHTVIAPDLPSMGADRSDPAAVTLDSWARFGAGLVARQAEPVVLVGHSRAGIVVSQVAELVPDRIRRLVYVAGFMLPSGQTLADAARADEDSLVSTNMIPAASGITCTVRREVLHDAFFGHCTDDDYEFALANLSPEPLKPLVTPLKLSAQRFGSVPRSYFECLQDRAVTLPAQRRMQAELPCDMVHSLESDHSPFFSRTAELASLLGAA